MDIKTIDALIEKLEKILENKTRLLQKMDNFNQNNSELEKRILNDLKFIIIDLDESLAYLKNFKKNNLPKIQIHVGYNTAGSPVYRDVQIEDEK